MRFFSRRMVLLAALLLTIALRPAAADPSESKQIVSVPIADAPGHVKYALVIGINAYDSSSIHPLTVCGRDAKDFAALLRTKFKFQNVVLMTDDSPADLRPTQRNIQRALKTLYAAVLPGESEVMFFYSGHGARTTGEDAGDADWLVPSDGDPDDIAGTCINYDSLRARIDTLGPRRAVLVTDACRSLYGGKALGDGKGFGGALSVPVGPEIAELRSCLPTQISQEGDPKDFKESVFTHYLIRALSGDPDAADTSGTVTFDSLEQYLRGTVSSYVAGHFNLPQTPDGSTTEGSMVLAALPPPPAPPPSAPHPVVPSDLPPAAPYPVAARPARSAKSLCAQHGVNIRQAEAVNRLGLTYYAKNDNDSANALFAAAVALAPGKALYRLNHASTLLNLNRWDEAKSEDRKAMKLGWRQPHWTLGYFGIDTR